MKHVVMLLLSMMLLGVAVSLSQIAPLEAKPGYVATGAVQSESNDRLYLNTNPCGAAGDSRVVIFHKPYVKTVKGQIDCYPNHFDRVTVEQQ